MRYLYFKPKTKLGTHNNKWSSPHHQSLSLLLHGCSKMEQLVQIHAQIIRTHLAEFDPLASRIIAFLTSTSPESHMDYARRVFDQIPHPKPLSCNSLMRGYVRHRSPKEAILLFKRMLRDGSPPDSYTFTILAGACAHLGGAPMGEGIHGLVVKFGIERDIFVMSGFIRLYAGYGRIAVARKIFDGMPERDVVSWTLMLSAYAQLGLLDEAFLLFGRMKEMGVEPNEVTIMTLLSGCGHFRALERGRCLHTHILGTEMEGDTVVANSLISMYAKCGVMSSANEVFCRVPVRNTATWNSMIGGLVQNGRHMEALAMFEEMKVVSDSRPDEYTIVTALLACTQLGDLQKGKLLHSYIKDRMGNSDVFVRNALINMYAKCGELAEAESIFLEMPERDVFSWTAMISGYAQGNRCKDALALFEEMQLTSVEPSEVTLVSVLSACAQIGALDRGRRIHSYIEERKMKKDLCLQNALVDMYAKCGGIEIASRIFHGMPQKDTFSWNAMIGGLATHGHGREALDLFNQMQSIGDSSPDKVTLIAVLGACSHSGLVREGFYHFNSMCSLYGIAPSVEHYGCIIDLLGRAGLIHEAIEFIGKMPMAPNNVIIGSLLAGCRVHSKIELGEGIVHHLMKLIRGDEGVLVLVSNLYAEASRWDDVRRVRASMGRKGEVKSAGCSSIEVDGLVHEFFVGYQSLHHDLIYVILGGLALQSKQFA